MGNRYIKRWQIGLTLLPTYYQILRFIQVKKERIAKSNGSRSEAIALCSYSGFVRWELGQWFFGFDIDTWQMVPCSDK